MGVLASLGSMGGGVGGAPFLRKSMAKKSVQFEVAMGHLGRDVQKTEIWACRSGET